MAGSPRGGRLGAGCLLRRHSSHHQPACGPLPLGRKSTYFPSVRNFHMRAPRTSGTACLRAL
eukprot:2061995-Heterocapsa_arctica.AAC.1